ncbi:MAG TPA: hypothetical protein PKI55_04195 [Chitinophagaceae bacterium]|nr:hypothetical protein [Chitinophagaceae bacterium]
MQEKATALSKIIRNNILDNHEDTIRDYGLWECFCHIYESAEKIADKNRLVCYVNYAYNPESYWLDLKKDRIDNKTRILVNLEAEIKSDLYKKILKDNHEPVLRSIFAFLEELKDWRWRAVYDYLDYAAKISRFAINETEEERQYEKKAKDGQIETYTEEIDIEVIAKVNKQKGELLNQAHKAREKAEEIMREIRKDFAPTDDATQSDFGFSFSDTAKKKNIMSWREFIRSKTPT